MYYPVRTIYNAAPQPDTDYLSLASSPCHEPCIQAGGNAKAAILECIAYMEQLTRIHGEPPEACALFILKNDHDFGTYYEAAIRYCPENEKAIAYAIQLEQGPEKWDADALKFLQEAKHPLYAAAGPNQLSPIQ